MEYYCREIGPCGIKNLKEEGKEFTFFDRLCMIMKIRHFLVFKWYYIILGQDSLSLFPAFSFPILISF